MDASYQSRESKAVDAIKKAIPSSLKSNMLPESRGMFAELFENSLQQNVKEGEVVKGLVVAIHGKDVIVDIHYKAEGILAMDEFNYPSEVSVVMEVNVLFEGFNDEKGVTLVSKRKADRQRTWNDLLSNAQEGSIVEGTPADWQ